MSEPSDLAESVAERLRGRPLATAESVTGGEVAQVFTHVGGSSDWFRGGLVAWQHRAKYELLGVPEGDPVVTADAARAMAAGAAKLLDATVTVATTGAAGPSGQDGAPPGRAYVATWVDGRTAVRELQVPGPPPTVCAATVVAALELLLDELG
jgi:nicotinamide-nucleotide amidase